MCGMQHVSSQTSSSCLLSDPHTSIYNPQCPTQLLNPTMLPTQNASGVRMQGGAISGTVWQPECIYTPETQWHGMGWVCGSGYLWEKLKELISIQARTRELGMCTRV